MPKYTVIMVICEREMLQKLSYFTRSVAKRIIFTKTITLMIIVKTKVIIIMTVEL